MLSPERSGKGRRVLGLLYYSARAVQDSARLSEYTPALDAKPVARSG